MANGIDFGTAVGLIKGLGSPDPAVIESAVNGWLDDHPEATTTVQDGSITKAKLDSNLQGTVDDVADLKSQIDDYVVRTVVATSGDIVDGEAIDTSGNPFVSVNFNRTDYINIIGCGGTDIVAHCSMLALYDKDKKFLKYAVGSNVALWSDITVSAPSGTVYIRMSGPSSTYTGPTDYNVTCAYFTDTALLDAFASEEEVAALSGSVGDPVYANLIDVTKITDAYVINSSTGQTQTNANGWSCTDYLLLRKNTTYTFNKIYWNGFFAFYSTSDKSFVSSPDVTVDRISPNDNYYGYITVGANDLYFRGSLLTANKETAFVSSAYGEYKPYGVVSLKEQIANAPCKFKKILIIGDSISAYNYGNYNKWVQALMMNGYFPGDINNNSVHATGYVASLSGQGDDTFGVRLEAVTSASSYDLVVVFGGVNDFIQNIPMGTAESDADENFIPAVNEFYSYLAENFLNARVLVILPMKCSTAYNASGAEVTNTAGNKLSDYTNYIKSIAELYSFPVFDLVKECGFYPWVSDFKTAWTNSADGLHPTADYSAKFLAPLIRKFIDKY